MNNNQSVTVNETIGIPFSHLARSDKNMRTVHPDGDADDQKLIASIREHGILQNLCVYKDKDCYRIPAGGRRFGALEYLNQSGELPDDFLVQCLVIDSDDAEDLSLAENYQRKEPHPADTFTAFVKLMNAGATVTDLAKRQGITEAQVQRYLRLGDLHPELFERFKRDEFTTEQIMAYASTPDQQLQIATFKSLSENTSHAPDRIRNALHESRVPSTAAIAQFVGIEEYEKAGGATESDLFTSITYFLDVSLLTTLAESKLDTLTESIEGWKWCEKSLEGGFHLYHFQRIPSKISKVPESIANLLNAMELQYNELDQIPYEELTEEQDDLHTQLSDEIDELKDTIDREHKTFKKKDMQYAGCLVTFNQISGEPEIHRGLLRKEDVKAFNDSTIKPEDREAEDSPEKTVSPTPPAEISASLATDLGLYRRSIISAELANNKTVAYRLMEFQLCLNLLGTGDQHYFKPLDMSFHSVSNEASIGDYKETKAGIAITERYSKLDLAWLSARSQAKQYEAFSALSKSKREALVAYCVAMQLSAGTIPTRNKFIDIIVDELGIVFHEWWRPNADNYFSRLTKPSLLAFGKRLKGKAWADKRASQSKKDLVAGAHSLIHNSDTELSEKQQQQRDSWVPPQVHK